MPKKNKRNKTDGLSKAELKLIALLLTPIEDDEFDIFAEEYLKIPATEENKDIAIAMFEWNEDIDDRQDEVKEILEAKDEIEVQINWLCSYLADRCRKLSR